LAQTGAQTASETTAKMLSHARRVLLKKFMV
jgi:hypothetical protein